MYSVTNGSKAADAGFKPGDLIISADGTKITQKSEYEKVIDSHKVGDVIDITVSRSGKEQTISLELTEYTPSMGDIVAS